MMDIKLELLRTKSEMGMEETINHTFQFHPIRSVDTVVRVFVNKFYKRKTIEVSPLTADVGAEEALVVPPSQAMLRALSVVYPDIDPEYLNQTCQRFYNRPEDIQTFLEANLHLIPARRQVQSVQFNVLRAGSDPQSEKMWQCPDCRSDLTR